MNIIKTNAILKCMPPGNALHLFQGRNARMVTNVNTTTLRGQTSLCDQ